MNLSSLCRYLAVWTLTCSTGQADAEWTSYGLNGFNVLDLASSGDYVFAALSEDTEFSEEGRGIYRRYSGHPDSTWTLIGLDLPTLVRSFWVDPDESGTILAAMGCCTGGVPPHPVYRTVDGGASWVGLDPGLDELVSARVIVGSRHATGELLLAAHEPDGMSIYRSSDLGDSWVCIPGQCVVGPWAMSIVYDPVHAGVVWSTFREFSFGAGILKSEDFGATWVEQYPLPPSKNYAAQAGVDRFSGRFYAICLADTVGAGEIARTDDLGESWSTCFVDGPRLSDLEVPPWTTGHVLVTAINPTPGVWLTRTGGDTWEDFGENLPADTRFQALASDAQQVGRVYVGTQGQGVWTRTIGDVVATADLEGPENLPLKLSVSTNPVRRLVHFSIKGGPYTAGTLTVFDATGRAVWTSSTTERRASWDGRDQEGRRVAQGVYLARYDASGFSQTVRFVWIGS